MYLNLELRGQVTVPPRKQYGTVDEDQIAISSLSLSDVWGGAHSMFTEF
jgi:hypothetical protein